MSNDKYIFKIETVQSSAIRILVEALKECNRWKYYCNTTRY